MCVKKDIKTFREGGWGGESLRERKEERKEEGMEREGEERREKGGGLLFSC